MIQISGGGHSFHLYTRHYSYAMHVLDGRFLTHLYWGSPLGTDLPLQVDRFIHPAAAPYLAVLPRGEQASPGEWHYGSSAFSLDTLAQEYPVWGTGEQRRGALELELSDGTEALRLEYSGHQLMDGAVYPRDLPGLREDHELGSVQTLRIRLEDPRGDVAVDLHYLVIEESGALLRWTRVSNVGTGPALLRRAMSASVDLPTDHYDVVTLAGSWARERHVQRGVLTVGHHETGTRSGASSHRTNPWLALCQPEAGEHVGQVWSMALMYSGNFSAAADGDQYGAARMSVGIHGYRGHIDPGDSFESPVAVLAHSDRGFNGMSGVYHDLLRHGIVASRWRGEPRKTIINSWEAMYFDLSAEKVRALARAGKEIGAELLVLDDGWFSHRRDDTSSLGDWWVNRDLFPEGLQPVAQAVRDEGLEFGIWIEPEMVSPESDLFREHPEWVLQISGRKPTLARQQLTLDLSNPAVVDHLFQTVSEILRESTATYVKWDMNRGMTEVGSPALGAERQGEVAHLYMLGLYRLLDRLTEAFPAVLIEGCAGGGGRFDLGLARYSPRFWTSDQTDAVERLDVQYGTSLVFPPEMIGAHVSSVPNHQVGRSTPALTRVHTAVAFSYGYELNPPREAESDRQVFQQGSELYRRIRKLVRHGRFYRLGSASGSGGAGAPVAWSGQAGSRTAVSGETGGARAWMVRARGGSDLLVFLVRPLARTNFDPGYLRLPAAAVESGAVYRDRENGRWYSGGELTSRGLWIGYDPGDYSSRFWHLTREKDAT